MTKRLQQIHHQNHNNFNWTIGMTPITNTI